MKKCAVLLSVFVPVIVMAQLDRIRPGMPEADFQKQFPAAQYVPMKSWINSPHTEDGIDGNVSYYAESDTVRTYQFTSNAVAGPCAEYPGADSAAVEKLLEVARTLSGHYSDIFGTPSAHSSAGLTIPPPQLEEVNVFYSKWKTPLYEITVSVHRWQKLKDDPRMEINGPHTPVKASCDYYFEVSAMGKGLQIKGEFGIGITTDEFLAQHPDYAGKISAEAAYWQLDDTLTSNYGSWRFTFVNSALAAFSLDIYDGPHYGNGMDSGYAAVRERALALVADAEKQFGKADSASKKFPEKLHSRKPSNNYYRDVYYEAKWKKGKDGMEIVADEFGGGKTGAPVIHLHLYYGPE
ncbi:MAG TPA: hypothetical protein VFU15_16565 [Bacteroidia bacterium]|nr:hypothetical protein [Bacteroidia bacterium]